MGKYEDECYKRYFDFLCEVDKRPKNTYFVMSKKQLNIAKEAEKRYLGRPEHQYYSAEDLAKAFRDGAEWADKHPQDVWHEVSEKPQDNSHILIRYNYLGTMEFKSYHINYQCDLTWSELVNFQEINYWAYVKDLLPKECEK